VSRADGDEAQEYREDDKPVDQITGVPTNLVQSRGGVLRDGNVPTARSIGSPLALLCILFA
jgi:hypothetical protein